MSLLLGFHRKNHAVLACDSLISVERDGHHVPLQETFPKFRIFGTQERPIVIGAVGRDDLCNHLNTGLGRMIADHNCDLTQLEKSLPHILRPLFHKRPPSTNVSPHRDGIQVAAVGFDQNEQRIRSFLFIPDDFEPIETTADPNNCLFALGWLAEDFTDLQKFSSFLGRNAERHGDPWTAREMGKKINETSDAWPGQVGRAAYFAALGPRGLLRLPDDLAPLPHGLAPTANVNASRAMQGTYRFYVGSIVTPAAGAPDTIGSGDGGATAQVGWLNSMLMTEQSPSIPVGTGTVSNPENAFDGDLTTFATLEVTGNGVNGNAANLFLKGPPGLIQNNANVTLQILASVLTNTLNGNVANACFFANYSVNGVVGGTVVIPAMALFPTGVSGQPHTFALQTFTVSLPLGVNPGIVTIGIYCAANSDSTSGSLIAKIYDVRLVSQQ